MYPRVLQSKQTNVCMCFVEEIVDYAVKVDQSWSYIVKHENLRERPMDTNRIFITKTKVCEEAYQYRTNLIGKQDKSDKFLTCIVKFKSKAN